MHSYALECEYSNDVTLKGLIEINQSIKETFSNQKGAHMCPQMPTYKLSLTKKKEFLQNRSNYN